MPPLNDALASSPPRHSVVNDTASRFPITHHITLQSLPSNSLTLDAVRDHLEQWHRHSHVPEKNETHVFVRTYGRKEVGRFSFSTNCD